MEVVQEFKRNINILFLDEFVLIYINFVLNITIQNRHDL